MKVVKFLLNAIVVIVAVVLVVILLLPLWFGPVVKAVANAKVPDVTKTDFHLGHIYLNPYTARFELREVQLANPAGYSEKQAVLLGDFTFDAETLSLMTDVIHINEITVKDVFVSVVDGGENNIGNFEQIQLNATGAKSEGEEGENAPGQVDRPAMRQELEEPELEVVDGEKRERKVIVDRLFISGLKIQYGYLPIVIPFTIELTDIGRKTGGATLQETWQQIWEGILKAANVGADQLNAALSGLGDATQNLTQNLNKTATQASESVNKLATQANDTAKAIKSVGDAATKATKDAAEALNSLKKLW